MTDDTGIRQCDLCAANQRSADNRYCGLDLCDYCFKGDLTTHLSHRGFSLDCRRWTVTSTRDNQPATHHVKVVGKIKTDFRPHARFNREWLGHKIKKFFKNEEVQAGDALFDDAIYVETDTPDLTGKLLADEGFQMVVLEGVADLRELKLDPAGDGCQVEVHTTSTSRSETPQKDSHQRIVAICLHYLQKVGAQE